MAPSAPDRLVLVCVALGVVALPLVNPKLPGDLAIIDLMMMGGTLAVVLWAGTTGRRLHLPYATPVAALMVTGSIAALLGVSPGGGMVAVVQDLFLLAWCGAIATICRTPRALATLMKVWVLNALGWAAVLIVAPMAGLPQLAGIDPSGEGRARLLFDHPNMAGNFFATSLFMVMASRYPRHPVARAAAYGTLFMAMVLAGSNAALMSLPLGLAVVAFINVQRRTDLIRAIVAAVGIALVALVAWVLVFGPLLTTLQEEDNSLVRYSVARSSRSAEDRETLFSSQLGLFQQGSLLGIGPTATKDTLEAQSAVRVKEAHNDYLATLVERGPLGAAALLGLIGAIGGRAIAVSTRRLAPPFKAVVPNPAAFAGVLISFAITSMTHEVLHYRHLWTVLGFLAAIYLFGREEPLALVAGRRSVGLEPARRHAP